MTLVGFKARNHPQQATRDDVDDRAVLPGFFEPLHESHQFTIDAAASPTNALLPRFWTAEDDALRQSWRGERVWCNPPYSDLKPWVAKAWAEMEFNDCALVVMLVPANRCEQAWWQRFVELRRDRAPDNGIALTSRFLRGRMRFRWPESKVFDKRGDRPPFGCVLLTWSRVGTPGEG